MPFYKISVLLRPETYPGKDREISVVRMYKEWDIDKLWHILDNKSREKWGPAIKTFNCVQISKRSADYQLFLQQQAGTPKTKNLNIQPVPLPEEFPKRPPGPGKYRSNK
jgi:hypothetical protein